MDKNLSKLLGTNSILVYDLETKTVGSRPDGTKDEFRIFGCYSYLTGKYHILTKPRLIKQMIDKHKFLVGFNNKEYDNNILFRMPVVADSDARTYEEKFDKTLYQGMYISKNGKCGFSNKITIDLMEIFKKRAGSMKIKKGMLGDLLMKFSLSYIAKTIELGSYKDDDFDYSLLQEPVEQWSKEKLQKIVAYTKQDLLVTKEMYEWLEEYFGAFKDFVSQENIDNKSYLTCSTAVFAYKCLCKELGMEEEYGESGLNTDFGGGFVALPTVLEEHGEILLYDWSSLYPSLFMMGNLFGDKCDCCTQEEKWNGDGFFNVQGSYCKNELAPLGKVLRKFYLMRKEMKKVKDPREYSIKIIINSCFSGDTDILTTTGIKNIKDCNVGDLVYSLNKDTEQVEIKPITDTQVFSYNGDMIHFKKRNVDLMVTPDHKMLLKKSKKLKIKEIEAQDFVKEKTNVLIPTNPIKGINEQYFDLSKFNIDKNWFIKLTNPYSQRKNKKLTYKPIKRFHQSLNGYNKNLKGNWWFQTRNRDMYIPKDVNIMDLFYLIGIFLSEGHVRIIYPKNYENGNRRGKTYNVFISQYETVNKKIYYKIKEILDNLQIRYSLSNKGFSISSHFWYHFLKQFTNENEKIIPDWIFKYDSSILYHLHDGLYDGDGDKRSYRYTTKYELLANQMIRLNLHLGYRCTMGYDSNCYRIWRTGGGLYIRNRSPMYSYIPNPDNKVYCVTVDDNHTVYAGRNKKLNWVGQCYGAVSNSTFKNIYNPIAGSDCTLLGRQVIRYSRKRFRKEGFKSLMTDSVGEDSKIWIKHKNNIEYVTFKELFKFAKETDERERYYLDGIKTLSVDKNLKISWKPIKYIFRHKNIKQCYELTQNSYNPLIVTEDHSLMNIKKGKLICKKPTNIKTAVVNWGFDIPKNTTHNSLMQFYGMWIGDGSYNPNGINIACGLDCKEFEEKILKKIKIQKSFNYGVSKHRLGDIKIHSVSFLKEMKSLGFIGYSHTKRIPKFIFNESLENRRSFLCGLFSSDGTVINRPSGSIIRYTTINNDLAEDIQKLLMSVGVSSSIIKETQNNTYKGKNNNTISHHVKVSAICNDNFIKHIGFIFDRKNNAYKPRKTKHKYGYSYFKQINKINYIGYVYDIEVEDTHNFFANNILVHNTDSVAIQLPKNKTIEDSNKVAEKITKELLSHFPFPQDFFEFKIDAEITDMFFVKDDRKHTREEFIVDGELDPDDERMINNNEFYLKKNYLYITKDGEVTFKNLNIKKKSVSALSRTLFREILIPDIKLKKSMRFSREFIDAKIKLLLDRDIGLAAIRYSVKDASEYKVEHQIQAQIARRYGAGIHFLIPNHKVGIGKKKKYCLLEEFKELGLGLDDLDLSGVYKELKYFIIPPIGGIKKKRSRMRPVFDGENLEKWF